MGRLTHRAGRGANRSRALPRLVLALTALLAAACGSSSAATGGGSGSSPSTSTTEAPRPAGKFPSPISKMVCSQKSQDELTQVLGVKAVRVETPTWVGHVYSCRIVYRHGSMMLSVKELSSAAETTGYYDSLGRRLGRTSAVGNLGQGAFTVRNGSVVVRKDWKVLLVDITGLPAKFGEPPTTRSEVAFTVADVILGCWSGD